jgi:hypothetical protein
MLATTSAPMLTVMFNAATNHALYTAVNGEVDLLTTGTS